MDNSYVRVMIMPMIDHFDDCQHCQELFEKLETDFQDFGYSVFNYYKHPHKYIEDEVGLKLGYDKFNIFLVNIDGFQMVEKALVSSPMINQFFKRVYLFEKDSLKREEFPQEFKSQLLKEGAFKLGGIHYYYFNKYRNYETFEDDVDLIINGYEDIQDLENLLFNVISHGIVGLTNVVDIKAISKEVAKTLIPSSDGESYILPDLPQQS